MTSETAHNLQKSQSLAFVEMRCASRSSSCYSTHSHDEFSLGMIDQGQAIYKNQGQQHHIGAGATVTINPGDAHSCNPQQGSWSYRMLFIDSHWLGNLQTQLFAKPVGDYWGFEQHYLTTSKPQDFDQLYLALLNGNSPLEAETLLMEYCQGLFAQPAVTLASAGAKKLQPVKDRIMDGLELNLPLAEYCQLADLSPHHLIRSFKKSYGQSPHAYQLDQRIKRAKLLLKQGQALADVANSLGFADQSHFQRNFKKRTAVTPRQYQQAFA